ncbi:MAG TPA: DUF4349 domain-containing protein [Candidatus Omnitrophica bacterium]|nr:DUF4349 domain-containing protein [Candidatus Omnitrophota bacterium]
MECGKIKGLLSDYIDGILDSETKELVKKHLLRCRECSKELSSLNKYLKELSSLQKVKAPEDFLEKVHQRLARWFELKRIIRRLFVPARIKVPWELVGVMTTVILIILLYNAMQTGRKTEEFSLVTSKVETPQELLKSELHEAPLEKERSISPGIIPEKEATFALRGEKEKPLEIALLIKPGKITLYDKGKMERKSVSMRSLMDAEVSNEVQLNSRGPVEEAGEKKYKAEPILSINDAVAEVRNVVALAGGEVLSVEEDKQANISESISVKIPAKNYDTLLKHLSQIGNIYQSQVISTEEREEPVTLRIRVMLLP